MSFDDIRDRNRGGGLAGGRLQGARWWPLALGTTAVVAGLGRHRKGAFVLSALAGVTAALAWRHKQHGGDPDAAGQSSNDAPAHEPQVERSITIGETADVLAQRWRDPQTLPQVMAGFATVRASGEGRQHWRVEGPLGRAYEWDTEPVDDGAGKSIGWRSLPGAPMSNDGFIRFRPAPADRGTVATLHLRFNPPGGLLGDAVVTLLRHRPLGLAAEGVLRRFKSLVETGEIPTTDRQPAARADTR
jgi:uncharacterized membrane protein